MRQLIRDWAAVWNPAWYLQKGILKIKDRMEYHHQLLCRFWNYERQTMNILGFEMIKDLSFWSLIDWSNESLGSKALGWLDGTGRFQFRRLNIKGVDIEFLYVRNDIFKPFKMVIIISNRRSGSECRWLAKSAIYPVAIWKPTLIWLNGSIKPGLYPTGIS